MPRIIFVEARRKQYTFLHLVWDFTLTMITGGVWLIWILIKFLRSNTR